MAYQFPSKKFYGVVLMLVLLIPTAFAQYTPFNLCIPNFSRTTGTVLSNTNGNWVTVKPQQPDNIELLETKLYEMPPKGSGLDRVDFILVGADGGTATYQVDAYVYFASGGQGADLSYTLKLDNNTAGRPFLVTFGKKGESVSSGYVSGINYSYYDAGGGGGSTGMAWVVPNAQFCQLNYQGPFNAHVNPAPNSPGYLIAAAGGGGGGFTLSGVPGFNGGGAVALDSAAQRTLYYNNNYDTLGLTYYFDVLDASGTVNPDSLIEIFTGGGSALSYNPTTLNPPVCCNDSDIFKKASSSSHNVFNVNYSVGTNYVLSAITLGQGGGQPTDIITYSSPLPYYFNGAITLGEDSVYVNKQGGKGGSGFGGGGAGVSSSTFYALGGGQVLQFGNDIASFGGGGGTGSMMVPTMPGSYPNNGGPGGSSFMDLTDSYMSKQVISPVTNTAAPQSGYFAYRTHRDTIPPVINSANVTVYIGNGFEGYPNTSVSLTAANTHVTDNDSVKTIAFSKTVFNCSDVGTTQTVLVSATDFAGNTTTEPIQVTVLNRAQPVVPIQSSYQSNIIDVSNGPDTLTAANFPVADGGCDTNLTIHISPSIFDCTNAGTQQIVSYYFTNSAGISSPVYHKAFTVTGQVPQILYVDASATGTNTGTSWANAFTCLQDAINHGCPSTHTIYVAQGTYYPDQGRGFNPGDRNATFNISDGHSIYGGFPTGGAVFNNRNPSAYPTILSGNIGNRLDSLDNAHHVVFISGNNTVLDGLTIQDGYEDDSTGSGGAGITLDYGSIYPLTFKATIHNCKVLHNFSNTHNIYGNTGGGGASFSFQDDNAFCSINVSDCYFEHNRASHSGGAVFIAAQSNPFLMVHNFINCLFDGNTAANGGAIFTIYQNNVSLVNCTFSQNSASVKGGAISNGLSGIMNAVNSLFYQDVPNEIYNDSLAYTLASYCDIQGTGGSSNWNYASGIVNSGNNIDTTPGFIGYGAYPFSIFPNSPCRNRGNTSKNNEQLDLAGTLRVAQDTIDIGAYETNPVVYVAKDAPNGGDGKSWATAYNDLQTGLNNASNLAYPYYAKDVWIKTGTYYPDSANGRFSSFYVATSNGLFGGFAGNETALSQRNIGANPTILSGDVGVRGDNSDNTYHVMSFNGASPRLDGLIIEGGNANGGAYIDQSSGAINTEGGYASLHAVAANCVFRNNTARNYGGAITLYADSFDFIQCLFYNNSATRGGAMYVMNGDPDTSHGSSVVARFYNCTAVNNSASGINTGGFCETELENGGHSNSATAQLNNCLLLNDGNPITSDLFNGNTIYNNTYAGTNNNDLVNMNNPAGPDSLIMTADDGFKLQPGSNAINYGNNTFLYPGDSADITGGTRIIQMVADAGAYENYGCLGATTVYVDANVDTANGDGKSWATAFRYLGDALQMASVCLGIDTILIAQGTYYPCGSLNNSASIDTAFLIANPVKIFGGYPTGGGTRNVQQYPVILNGAINTQNDSVNARHIMIVNSGSADTTLIDGITFMNGSAYSIGFYTFKGRVFKYLQGGAISAFNSLLHVNNCLFENNNAAGNGGAIYSYGGKFISTHSVYQNNSAYNGGGALNADGSADTITLIDNIFVRNSSTAGSGAGVEVTSVGNTYADVENNVFALNSAGSLGYAGGLYTYISNFKVVNNTFYSNSAGEGAGFYAANVYDTTALLANNIFWQNTVPGGDTDYYIGGVADIDNAVRTNPLFLDTGNLPGADGIWFTADDGLELKPTSPLINSGSNLSISSATDITGAARIQLGTVDPGAYEADSMITHWYVSQRQDSAVADGASWATAFQKFQQGVNAAKPGDTVWVAVGTYTPDSAGTSFSMKNRVKVFGGFNATEQSLTQRNLSAGYNAVLQGNAASVIFNTGLDSTALLDGFVIANGNSATQGGGMLNDSSSPLIRNVVFTTNIAATDGGAIANLNSSPVLQNVVFNADSAGGRGGAIFNNASKVSLVNSTFYNNAAGVAGAIYSDANSQLWVGNSVFNNNTAPVSFDIYTNQTGNFTYCMLQYARTGTGNIVATNPGFNYVQQPSGFDGAWFTGDDGLYLGYLSAGLNGGLNGLVTALSTDIAGAARIQNGNVDMGAYESPWVSYCDSVAIKGQRILYVDGTLPASGDGSNWLNAFNTLGDALDRANACSYIDTILVAKGTYYPTGWQGLTDRTATFNILRSGVTLVGGYPVGGGVRNTATNNTYLSGDIGVADSAADNSYHVITFTAAGSNSGVDGFIITGGNADSTGSFSCGGGIFNNGAGDSSMPAISNCALVNNQANFGGAVYNQGQLSGNASASFTNCVFATDSAYYDGGAMYNSGLIGNASPVITNCTFYGNGAGRYAGAVYDDGASGNCSTVLLNCILWGNTAASGANDQKQVYSSSATDSVIYSLVQDGVPASMLDGGHNISSDPLFAADTVPAGFNGTWFDKYDGLAVKAGSPVVRAGRPTGSLASDITGFTRLPVPDMGAYQLRDTAVAGYVSITTTACDSFLSPTFRHIWYTSGIYRDTTANVLGNDTFYTVNITIGKTAFSTINPVACSSYFSPGGKIYNATGVYHDTLQTATSCDSFITINLVINNINDTAVVSGVVCSALQTNATYQWVDCSNGQAVSGATHQTFAATKNGNYACVVTTSSCTDTTNCVAVTGLSVTETQAYRFNIYPNPTDGLFTIEQDYAGELNLQITDALGRKVKMFMLTAPTQKFDITELQAGVYQLFISNDAGIIDVVKLVRQ